MLINVNDTVRVRLTDYGRKIHRESFRKLNSQLPITANFKYTPPIEDADGWSSWQLWVLMEHFGSFMFCGFELVFETNIEIPDPPMKQEPKP